MLRVSCIFAADGAKTEQTDIVLYAGGIFRLIGGVSFTYTSSLILHLAAGPQDEIESSALRHQNAQQQQGEGICLYVI